MPGEIPRPGRIERNEKRPGKGSFFDTFLDIKSFQGRVNEGLYPDRRKPRL